MFGQLVGMVKTTVRKAVGFVKENSRGAVAAAVAGGVLAGNVATATDPSFDVATLYTGAATAFTAAATVAGGFLAIKFGAKLVKKAWAWLT